MKLKISVIAICGVAFMAAPSLPGFTQEIAQAWPDLDDVHLDYVPRSRQEQARIDQVTQTPKDFGKSWKFEENSAGAQTVRPRENADAFSQPAANLSFEQELEFKVGNGLFKRLWVSAPASTIASDGLGPLFNGAVMPALPYQGWPRACAGRT